MFSRSSLSDGHRTSPPLEAAPPPFLVLPLVQTAHPFGSSDPSPQTGLSKRSPGLFHHSSVALPVSSAIPQSPSCWGALSSAETPGLSADCPVCLWGLQGSSPTPTCCGVSVIFPVGVCGFQWCRNLWYPDSELKRRGLRCCKAVSVGVRESEEEWA